MLVEDLGGYLIIAVKPTGCVLFIFFSKTKLVQNI